MNDAENAFPANTANDVIHEDFSVAATSADTSAATIAGKVSFIGPYRLLSKLGEGGMGSVWLAQQAFPVKRQVAIKVIKAEMSAAKHFSVSSWSVRHSP